MLKSWKFARCESCIDCGGNSGSRDEDEEGVSINTQKSKNCEQ